MSEVTIIGIDSAKRTFQLHGARDRSVVFRKKLSRSRFVAFVAQHQGASSPWKPTRRRTAGEFEKLEHEAHLIPPIYVKPFVKRQKTMRRMPRRS